jgi:hypothetical protein
MREALAMVPLDAKSIFSVFASQFAEASLSETSPANNQTDMNKYSDRRIHMNRYSRVQHLNAASSCKYWRQSHL